MRAILPRLGRASVLVGATAWLALIVAALPWLRGEDPARSVPDVADRDAGR